MFKRLLILSLSFLLAVAIKADVAKITSFDQGLKKAAAEKKKIFLLFTGSDWCPYCKYLDKELLATEEFKAYAAKNLVYVYIDFPKKKKLQAAQLQKNRELAEKFGIKGYPTVVILDDAGKEIKRFGYSKNTTPADYIKKIDPDFVGKTAVAEKPEPQK